MVRPQDDRTAYRCVVAPENSGARLKIGRKFYDANVLDTSRSGFSVRLPNAIADKLRDERKYELNFAGEKWEVVKASSYSESLETTNIGFTRVKEITKFQTPSTPFYAYVPKLHAQTDPAFLMFLMLAFLIACVALPGIGDGLGTAPKVRKGIHIIVDEVKDTFR